MASEEMNTSLIDIKVPASIDNAINNLTDKPTETIGEVISDCLFLVFGWVNQKAELRRAKYKHELKEFTKELEKKIGDIPVEQRMEPNVHTVCTALDNMRYCVEEPVLRNMFSNLIANSINSQKTEHVHSAYGEVIKSLMPNDARVILWMKDQEAIPAIRFRVQTQGTVEYIKVPVIYLANCFDDIFKLQVSLDNLARLKIIDIRFDTGYADKNFYFSIKKSKHYLRDKDDIEAHLEKKQEIKEEYGVIEITRFGREFIAACC